MLLNFIFSIGDILLLMQKVPILTMVRYKCVVELILIKNYTEVDLSVESFEFSIN